MCPPAASPANDISLYCSDKEIFMSLEKIESGKFPSNVIPDVNPYQCRPWNLPEKIWFFIRSNMKKDAEFGYWRIKGEACQVFSNSSIIGWRSTLEFNEGQAPHGNKTDWVMQEYWITQKILSKDINEKELSLLCNVFYVGEPKPNHETPREKAQADTANQSTKSVFQNAVNESATSSKPQLGEDNGAALSVTIRERVPDDPVDIVPELDYPSGDDYLELLDLENPASPSSSSDSSCITMSSDECFDALDLLRDLEPEKSNDLLQNNPGSKLSVHASSRPYEIIMYPAKTGTLDKSSSEKLLENDRSMPGSAMSRNVLDTKVKANPSGNQKPELGNEGIPPTSGNRAVTEEDRKAARGRTKKKLKMKYLCFMPF